MARAEGGKCSVANCQYSLSYSKIAIMLRAFSPPSGMAGDDSIIEFDRSSESIDILKSRIAHFRWE